MRAVEAARQAGEGAHIKCHLRGGVDGISPGQGLKGETVPGGGADGHGTIGQTECAGIVLDPIDQGIQIGRHGANQIVFQVLGEVTREIGQVLQCSAGEWHHTAQVPGGVGVIQHLRDLPDGRAHTGHVDEQQALRVAPVGLGEDSLPGRIHAEGDIWNCLGGAGGGWQAQQASCLARDIRVQGQVVGIDGGCGRRVPGKQVVAAQVGLPGAEILEIAGRACQRELHIRFEAAGHQADIHVADLRGAREARGAARPVQVHAQADVAQRHLTQRGR